MLVDYVFNHITQVSGVLFFFLNKMVLEMRTVDGRIKFMNTIF